MCVHDLRTVKITGTGLVLTSSMCEIEGGLPHTIVSNLLLDSATLKEC